MPTQSQAPINKVAALNAKIEMVFMKLLSDMMRPIDTLDSETCFGMAQSPK
jgi:hypothetical protein